MGYNSYITSDQTLTFSRLLTAREVRDAQTFIGGTGYLSYFLKLDVIEEEIETDEGTLTKITASGLSTTGNEGKAYGLADELQNFLSILPADVTVSGYIERIGEEWPDAERLYVDGRTVTSVRPEIAWRSPDGTYQSVKVARS